MADVYKRQDDYKATGVLRAALGLGMRVPEDLSVMGHNNYQISELTTPPLTTVDVYKRQAKMVSEVLAASYKVSGKSFPVYNPSTKPRMLSKAKPLGWPKI